MDVLNPAAIPLWQVQDVRDRRYDQSSHTAPHAGGTMTLHVSGDDPLQAVVGDQSACCSEVNSGYRGWSRERNSVSS